MSNKLHFKPAYELAAMIRRRELKPSELMTATIARIEQTNPKINAFVALRSDHAMALALQTRDLLGAARIVGQVIERDRRAGAREGLDRGEPDARGAAGDERGLSG